MAGSSATSMSWTGAATRRRLPCGCAAALPLGVALVLALVAPAPAGAAEQGRFIAVPALFSAAAVATEALDKERASGLGEVVDTNPSQGRELAVILWDETNGKHVSATVGENVSLVSIDPVQFDPVQIDPVRIDPVQIDPVSVPASQ